MDVAYQTGQRPADALSMRWSDVRDSALEIKQDKTGKRLRILLTDNGQQIGLGLGLDRIRQRPGRVMGFFIIATNRGQRVNRWTLRIRFDAARAKAVTENSEITEKIMQFQFRDIRPKAASETDLAHAQVLLGHSKELITQTVYRRVGSMVSSTT
jgi:integrase